MSTRGINHYIAFAILVFMYLVVSCGPGIKLNPYSMMVREIKNRSVTAKNCAFLGIVQAKSNREANALTLIRSRVADLGGDSFYVTLNESHGPPDYLLSEFTIQAESYNCSSQR